MSLNVTSTTTIPPYFVFGRTDIGQIAVPKRVGPPLSRQRKIIDQFNLQADPGRAVFGVPSAAGGGFWDGWLLYANQTYPPSYPQWPTGWQNGIDPVLLQEGFAINVAKLEENLTTFAGYHSSAEEYWYMPNIESNSFVEFDPYLRDPYNPTPEHTLRLELMSQAYRFIGAKWRAARPNGCYAYYVQRAMLAHIHSFTTPFPNGNEALKLRNERYGYSRVGNLIDRQMGVHDSADIILGEVYVASTNTDDQIKANIHSQMAEAHHCRKPGQLVGAYMSPQYTDSSTDPNLSDRQLALVSSELRRAGAERMVMWGFQSNDGVSPWRYASWWQPKFDLMASCFL